MEYFLLIKLRTYHRLIVSLFAQLVPISEISYALNYSGLNSLFQLLCVSMFKYHIMCEGISAGKRTTIQENLIRQVLVRCRGK